MSENHIDFKLSEENFKARRKNFLALNPVGEIPVLYDKEEDISIYDSDNICRYLEEKNSIPERDSLFGSNIKERIEVNKIKYWFDNKFFKEVVSHLLHQKLFFLLDKKPYSPNVQNIRIAKYNLDIHLDYIDFLLSGNKWLATEKMTIADIVAACQISVIDYLGDVNWKNREAIKEWYCIIKSRKSFQSILKDKFFSFVPPKWYNDLDF